MTDQPTTPRGVSLRVELVNLRMRLWGLTSGDRDYIDTTDPANLDTDDPRYVRANHPQIPAYRDRIHAERADPTLGADDIDDLRRHADQTSTSHRGDGRGQPAVTNVWRSDLTAAAEIQAQVRGSAGRADDAPVSGLLREDEIVLLDHVDPDQARTGRQVGGRMDWQHRRPERATDTTPGRQVGRSVDGSD